MKRIAVILVVLSLFVSSRAHAQLAQAVAATTLFSSGPLSFGSNPTAGNTVIVTIEARSDGTNPTVSTVASTNDTLVNKNSNAAFPNTYTWCKDTIVGGANSKTITVTQTGGTGNIRMNVIMYEVNAASATCTVDKSQIASGSSTAPNTGALATTTNANDFVIGVLGASNGLSNCATAVGTAAPSNPTTGWSVNCQSENGLGTQNTTGWLVPGSTGAFELAGTIASGSWSGTITAFLPTATVAPTTPQCSGGQFGGGGGRSCGTQSRNENLDFFNVGFFDSSLWDDYVGQVQ